MNSLIISFCCSLLISFNFNPLLSLERAFADQLYAIRSKFTKPDEFPTFVKPNSTYTLVLVGDSMTQFLGDGSDIKKYLKKYYPKKEINILNYGIGSTNILTVPDGLEKGSIRGNESLFPVMSKNFDVILIESFGNNPINLPIDEALKKQTETLDKITKIIRGIKPTSVIVFIATVSPYKLRYAEGVVNLTTEERVSWAKERISYIKNHIEYAKSHKIPLINIYEQSLDEKGDGRADYIDSHDFIHPSPEGIKLISNGIAEYIFKKRVLPL